MQSSLDSISQKLTEHFNSLTTILDGSIRDKSWDPCLILDPESIRRDLDGLQAGIQSLIRYSDSIKSEKETIDGGRRHTTDRKFTKEHKTLTPLQGLEQEFLKLEATIGVHGIMYEIIEKSMKVESEQKRKDFTDGYMHGSEPLNHEVIDKWYEQTYGGNK
jgi:hypothetical protein